MNLQISGKNFELTPAIKQYAEEKLAKIERFDDHIIELRITIEHGHEHHDDAYTVTAHAHVKHHEMHCSATQADVYASIDQVKDELQRQVRDLKSKHHSKQRKSQREQREMKSIV